MKFNLITNKKQRKETFKLTYEEKKTKYLMMMMRKSLKNAVKATKKKEKNILTDNRLLMKIRCI